MDETGTPAGSRHSRHARTQGRAFERALVLAAAAALLSRGRSLVPRTPQDQALIATGAGLMGAAAGLVGEGATRLLAKLMPGGRAGAAVLLGGLSLGALAWSARRAPGDRKAAIADTAGRVLLVASVGGELALSAHSRLPARQRRMLLHGLSATALGAASAFRALRRRLAEPRDLVKASIHYDFLPTVSGGPGSRLPLSALDREGRKFLGCSTAAARIAGVMGTPALDPIRVYAGLDSGSSSLLRARLAVAELERLGGFERSRVVLYCPTGAGYVDPVAVEAEELMSRGDVASVVVQYSNKRAVRAFKQLARARETWWLLLEALDRALAAEPPERRPEIVVYGESLGAQVVAETLSEGGTETLRSFNIARGALIGLPFAGGEKLRALRARGEPLPPGLAVVADLEELAALPPEPRAEIRYVIFTHAEDPVANFTGTRLLWERPYWLRPEGRHPRLPPGVRWLPGITYLQALFDVKNSTGFTPTFEAHAHDYRLELPALLRVAFGHSDVSDAQLRAIELETARAAVQQAEREGRAGTGSRTA